MEPPILVLHVEDDYSVTKSVAMLLSAAGHICIPVDSADHALAWVSRRTADPDVLIVDFGLPGEMQGGDVAQEIHRRLARALPTIILSARLTDVDLPWVPGSPMLCVWKPVDPEILLKAVETFATFGRFARSRMLSRRGENPIVAS